MISVEAFIENFRAEWKHTVSAYPRDLLLRISDTRANKLERTKFMLDKGGFLHRVMNRFLPEYPDLDYQTEIYTFDALYMGGGITYRSRTYNYPTHIYAIIEHENESNVEEEMWKLLIVRPVLKVLIFYDYGEHRKSTHKRKTFVRDKISSLQQMIDRAHSHLPETTNTVYLCLVGNRKTQKSLLTWRWTKTNAQFKFEPFNELIP